MARYTVQPPDPARVAAAVIRYQLDRPGFRLGVLAAIVVGAAIGAAASGGAAAVIGALAALIVCVATVTLQRRTLTDRLRRVVFRPGSTVEAVFAADEFTVGTAAGRATYPYARVQHGQALRGCYVVRLAGARSVIVLPAELVPDERAAQLGVGRRRS